MSRVRGFSGLTWVSGELGLVIREARDALEKHLEDDGNSGALATAVTHLSQVRGVLQMLHLSGAARLAEEMQETAKAMLEAKIKTSQDASEPLMLALILLPDYIEKLEATDNEDLPSLLLGTINDLRRSRGAPLLNETDLIIADLIQSMAAERLTSEAASALQAFANTIRPRLHKGLLSWLRGPNHREGIFLLGEVFAELARYAEGTPLLYGMLSAAHAITVGIIEGSIEEDRNVKTLIGRVDRNIKELAEQGLHAAAKGILPEQFQELLRLVAGAKSTNAVICKVQNDYELARIFPSEAKLADGQRWLVAPSANALSGVRAAVIKELLPIKDTLDLFMRGSLQINQLEDLSIPVQRLSNTLEMVGLDELGLRLHGRSLDLRAIGSGEIPANEDLLMGIAADLLLVESYLGNTTGDADGEMRGLVVRTLKEAALDMTKAKQAIIAYTDSPNNMRSLEATPTLFHGVAGALRVVGHNDAANLLDQARNFIQNAVLTHNIIPDPPVLDALAECIAGIEYYMEAVADGRSDVTNILEISGNALQRLLACGSMEESSFLPMVNVPGAQKKIPKSLEQDETEEISSISTQPVNKFIIPDIDPEIVEIFLEEARETESDIRQFFGRWRADHDDSEALTAVRRAFHTLKGSGRLAKAMEIGEFSWTVENLLNRVIDQSVSISSAVIVFVGQAIDALPELIQAQEQHRSSKVSLTEFTRRADELLGKRVGKESSATPCVIVANLPNQNVQTQPLLVTTILEPVPPPKITEIDSFFVESAFDDPVLRDIFVMEATQHLSTLSNFLTECTNKTSPYIYDEVVVRALHTLSGSANMAGIFAIASLAKALERKAEHLITEKLWADDAFLALLQEGTDSIRSMMNMLAEPGAKFDSQELVTKVSNYVCPKTLPAESKGGNAQELESLDGERQDIVLKFNLENTVNYANIERVKANENVNDDAYINLNEIDSFSLEFKDDDFIPTDSNYSIELDNLWTTNAADDDLPRIDISELKYEQDEDAGNKPITPDDNYTVNLESIWDNDVNEERTEVQVPNDFVFDSFDITNTQQIHIDSKYIIDFDITPDNAAETSEEPIVITPPNNFAFGLFDAPNGQPIFIDDDYAVKFDITADNNTKTRSEPIVTTSPNDFEFGVFDTPDIQPIFINNDYPIKFDTTSENNPNNNAEPIVVTTPTDFTFDTFDTPDIQPIFIDNDYPIKFDTTSENNPNNNAEPIVVTTPTDFTFDTFDTPDIQPIFIDNDYPIEFDTTSDNDPNNNVEPIVVTTPKDFTFDTFDTPDIQPIFIDSDYPIAFNTTSDNDPKNNAEPIVITTPNALPLDLSNTINAYQLPTEPQIFSDNDAEIEEFEELTGDPELHEIFPEEGQELLEQLEVLIKEWLKSPNDPTFSKEAKRIIHTLKGSGRVAGVQPVGAVSQALETLVYNLTPEIIRDYPQVFSLIRKAMERLYAQLEQTRTGGPVAKALALIAELNDAHKKLSNKTTTENKSQTPPVTPIPGLSGLSGLSGSPLTISPQSKAPGKLAAPLLQPILFETQPTQPELPETQTAILLQPIQWDEPETSAPVSGHDAILQQTPSSPTTVPLSISTVVEAREELTGNAEVRGAFLEEAVDMVAQLDTDLRQWIDAQDNPSFPSKIKRTLHTLKGSARSAEISSIGTLSHTLETLLDGLTPDLLRANNGVLTLAQKATDRIADQIEQVRDSGPVNKELALLEELETAHALITGQNTHKATDTTIRATQNIQEEFETPTGEQAIQEAFLEDAKDLLEKLNSRLQEWMASQDDLSFPRQIKHILHTIKGSARSAGIFSIGTLSHTLETLLEGVTPEQMKAYPDVLLLAQRAVDFLAEEVDYVRAFNPVPKGLALIAELERVHATLTGTEPTKPITAHPDKTQEVVPKPPIDESKTDKPVPAPQSVQELVRIRADLLDRLISNAGEINIYRARLEEYNTTLGTNLSELKQTVERLYRQLREMTAKTEEQISFRKGDVKEEQHQKEESEHQKELDPLELDRFSTLQLLSRTLAETVGDLLNIRSSLEEQQKEAVTLLVQHARISNDLQDGLLRTRMVPFSQSVQRLDRVVRTTATSLKKQVKLEVVGAEGEMDRNILERIVPALEHILRNAVGHGIELPERRLNSGKPKEGKITISLARERNEILLKVADDGNGLNLPAIRKRALERNLIKPGTHMEDNDVMQLILEPGFSTAEAVSEISGRGVGTDVAVSEVKQLGGSLEISSVTGKGATFSIRLPFTLAMTSVMLVGLDKEIFAVPHATMDGVVRISEEDLKEYHSGQKHGYIHSGVSYPVRYLGNWLGISATQSHKGQRWFPHLLVKSGDHRMAIQVDSIIGNRQIVMKSVGPQLSTVRWISGGTILVDGRVALILDVSALVRMDVVQTARENAVKPVPERRILAMVVDDSITVRKVTTNVLTRNNMNVITAKDGVDAIAQLQVQQPDVMLLDVEMPRMDGYELARHMRNSPDDKVKKIPIIMITSRTGETHRAIGLGLGVKRYLGKPYQEDDLLDYIYAVLAETEAESNQGKAIPVGASLSVAESMSN